ncbi:MAG: DUF308 domain-containing protein [Flavobacteriia bacterium]|nr:DUF308 domain-containing protein [Flavobacteriia bacterium]
MATFLKTIRNTVKHWYVSAIIGVLFIAFGLYVFTVPVEAYESLVLLFSLSFLISGILDIWFSVENRDELEGWGWYLASGILSLLIGILLFAKPLTAAAVLPVFVGFVLLFRSFQGLGFAFELKNYGVMNWGNLAILSVLGIVFSIILLANPIFTGLSLVVFTALTFIFVGISAIVLSFQLKQLKTFPTKVKKDLKDKIDDLKDEYYKAINDQNN